MKETIIQTPRGQRTGDLIRALLDLNNQDVQSLILSQNLASQSNHFSFKSKQKRQTQTSLLSHNVPTDKHLFRQRSLPSNYHLRFYF